MLAIVGGKGGCGKTTTALGLARALAANDRPLVVDADCDMPNLHTEAGTDPRPGLGAVADGRPVERTLHRSDVCPGVDVLPAGKATAPLATESLRRIDRARRRVLVDCPAGATEAVARPLRAADRALVVSTPDEPSLVDAAKTARMARALGATVAGAVITRTEPAQSTPGAGLAECDVLARVPELTDPCPYDDPAGRAAYERLADRLVSRNC